MLIIYSSPPLHNGLQRQLFYASPYLPIVIAAIGKIYVIRLCSALNRAETVGDALRLVGISSTFLP